MATASGGKTCPGLPLEFVEPTDEDDEVRVCACAYRFEQWAPVSSSISSSISSLQWMQCVQWVQWVTVIDDLLAAIDTSIMIYLFLARTHLLAEPGKTKVSGERHGTEQCALLDGALHGQLVYEVASWVVV